MKTLNITGIDFTGSKLTPSGMMIVAYAGNRIGLAFPGTAWLTAFYHNRINSLK